MDTRGDGRIEGQARLRTAFPKMVAGVLCGCFTLVTAASAARLVRSSEFSESYQSLVCLNPVICILACAAILGLLKAAGWLGERGRRAENLFAAALFLFMGALTLFVAFDVCPRPDTDSFDCIDAGAYVLQNGKVDDGFARVGNVGKFANNRLIILVFRDVIAMFPGLDTYGVLHVLYVINATCIMAAVAFYYVTVRACRGATDANRVLTLCALNPLYYGLVCWVYSMTFSLPIMMGALLFGLRLRRARQTWEAALWAAIEGVLVVLGYEVRPTACFTVVALAIVAVFVTVGPSRGVPRMGAKRLLVVGVVALIVAACCFGSLSRVKSRYFSDLEGRSYPFTYWLSMGSHDTGSIQSNTRDHKLVDSLAPEDRFAGMLESTLDNYRSQGVLGTIRLWAYKTVKTWSSGSSDVACRMSNNEAGESLAYEVMDGCLKDLFVVYCYAFRIVTTLGVVLACAEWLRRGSVGGTLLSLSLMLTIAIGVAFYCLWEAKDVYSAPFVLVMIMLASDGWAYADRVAQGVGHPARRVGGRVVVAALVVMTICVAVPLCGYASTARDVRHYRIRTIPSRHLWSRVHFRSEVRQRFFVSGSFNRVSLAVLAGDGGVGYTAALLDEGGAVLGTWALRAADVECSEFVLRLGKTANAGEGEWYELVVAKADSGEPAYDLLTGSATWCDSYRGSLYVDGVERVANDLKMDVSYDAEESLFGCISSQGHAE